MDPSTPQLAGDFEPASPATAESFEVVGASTPEAPAIEPEESSTSAAPEISDADSTAPPATPIPDVDQSPNIVAADTISDRRTALLQRIAESPALPRGIQGRLATALQSAPLVEHEGHLLAPVEALVDVIERWTPEALRLRPADLLRGDHPAGDSFFTGDSSHVSDEQAERIARQQLERSGYLRRAGG